MAEFWMSEIIKECARQRISLAEYIIRGECENSGST